MKKSRKIILSIIIVLILIVVGAGFYINDYYKADNKALNILKDTNVEETKDYLYFPSNEKSSIGLIFYPGGKVDYKAYAPLINDIRNGGINCYIVKMPFRLAVLNKNGADKVIENNDEIESWYIVGHSLGGAMASSYAKGNENKIKGLILLASYNYGEFNSDKTLIIYGSEDKVLNEDKLLANDNIKIINGGNHAYFGNYGEQKGDGKAKISRGEQQKKTIKIISENEIINYIQ